MKVSDTIGDKVQSAIPMDLQIRGAHLYDRTRRWVTRTNGKKLFVEKPIPPVEDVELATLGWVHWHNHDRLHGYLGDVPPAEFEEAFYATQRSDHPLVGIQ